jgi:hypothetical protein
MWMVCVEFRVCPKSGWRFDMLLWHGFTRTCCIVNIELQWSHLSLLPCWCLFLKWRRFVRRGFSACSIESIPEQRRKRINLSRGSKYYIKELQPKHAGVTVNNFVGRWQDSQGLWWKSMRYSLWLYQNSALVISKFKVFGVNYSLEK